MEMMDLVAAMPLFAMRTLRMARLPPRDLTYSSTASTEVEEALSRVAAQREVSIFAMFDGLMDASLFWRKALLIAPKTPLAGVMVLGVKADCWGAKELTPDIASSAVAAAA
jgi:hypothetical protein